MSQETKPHGCYIILGAVLLVLVIVGVVSLMLGEKPAPTANAGPHFPPWTVLCDGEGHFTFTWADGHPDTNPSSPYMDPTSRESVQQWVDRLHARHDNEEVEKKRVYHVCPEPEKP